MTKTLPEDFRKYTQELMGDELYKLLEHGITAEEAPTSIRLNPFKQKDGEDAGLPIPWCPSTGRYLDTRPNFTFDPWLHAGKYYVQEASSMFVDLAIRRLIHTPVLMLDLCAAPGGKSTALRAALPEGSLLMSNEPMHTRSQILSENIQKFGHPDVIVTNNYPCDYKKTQLLFDIILCDVPCSGEGMFRKDDGAIAEWSMQNVDNCWHLQREIVSDIWNNLVPGGILIYSTCTFNAHEDEENIAWICEELGATPVSLGNIDETWKITGNLTGSDIPVYRFLPGKSKGEGIFLAVLRKDGEAKEGSLATCATKGNKKKNKNKGEKQSRGNKAGGNERKQLSIEIPTNWLSHPSSEKGGEKEEEAKDSGMEKAKEATQDSDCTYQTANDAVFAIPSKWHSIYEEACSHLKVIHAGIKMGTVKGKDLIPATSLALSILLNKDAFPQVELSYEDAIRFLRKESVNLPEGTPKGYVLVTFKQMPLGWEKNIGNRANNLYPQEWKIKSTHIPEEPIIVKSK